MSHAIFNYFEAVLWISFGCALFAVTVRSALEQRRILYITAAILVVFGISDLIEVHTGAWWQPLWLLLMKASCIFSFILCLIYYIRNKRHQK